MSKLLDFTTIPLTSLSKLFITCLTGYISIMIAMKRENRRKKIHITVKPDYPEYGSGFNAVPASDSTSKWARNPN